MYIHKIRSSGADRRLIHLLRIGKRDGSKIRNFTLLNVSDWSEADRAELCKALRQKRKFRGTILGLDADAWVISLIDRNGGFSHPSMVGRIVNALNPESLARRGADGCFLSCA